MRRNGRGRILSSMRKALLTFVIILSGCKDPDEPGNLVPKTVEEDPSLPRIEVNGTILHSEAFGDPNAPMLVFLHGGPGGDYRQFLPYRDLANEGYRVVLWDQRGSGLSKRHDANDYDMPMILEDLRHVVEHYSSSKSQRIVFIGQSWGAMYATWFINEHGDYGGRVKGAVLSEPGAFTDEGLEDYMKRGFPPWSATSEELNDVAWFDQVFSKSSHARADYLVQVAVLAGLPREHNDPNNRAPLWRKGAVVNSALMKLALDEGFDWTTRLRAFRNKVLFVRGDRNENMPLEHQRELASHYANAEIITIPGAGHEAVWEKQSEFKGHVRKYLSEVLPLEGGPL
jgi:proline iminopeptidase